MNVLIKTMSFCILVCSAYSAISAELLNDEALYSSPSQQSASIGNAKKGSVDVVEKKGFWVRISSGNQTGWVKMNAIKMGEASAGLGSLNTARLAGGNIVQTSGVRGLDGNDLTKATPNFTEFGKFAKWSVGKDASLAFSREAGVNARNISPLKPSQPAPSDDSNNDPANSRG